MADRVQQVGLAQPGLAVDEQRVVGLGRRLGDRDRGGVGEPVARADDEGVEGVLRVQPGRLGPRGAPAGRAPGVPAAAGARRAASPAGGRRRRPCGVGRRARRSAGGASVGPRAGRARLSEGSTITAIRTSRAELVGQRRGDHLRRAAGLDHVLGVVVRHGHQRGVADQADQPGQPEEGRGAGGGCRRASRAATRLCQIRAEVSSVSLSGHLRSPRSTGGVLPGRSRDLRTGTCPHGRPQPVDRAAI